MVGPVRLGYGTMVAAGTILRNDSLADNKLIVGKSYKDLVTNYTPYLYAGLSRILGNNMIYLANLVALEQWYIHVRQEFFSRQGFGPFMHEGALEKLSLAKQERVRRLEAMAEKMPTSLEKHEHKEKTATGKREFAQRISEASELFFHEVGTPALITESAFLQDFEITANPMVGPISRLFNLFPMLLVKRARTGFSRLLTGCVAGLPR
jgi:predicted nuclease of restriction endonuclease-like RecB superfamily